MMYTLCLLLSLQLLHFSVEVPLKDFYSFGSDAGDNSLMPSDDESSRIVLSATFPFFSVGHNSLFVNNNGLLSFGQSVSIFTPQFFPLSENLQLIAPFWADVDTRKTGTVWFRETNDTATLNRIQGDIQDHAEFKPKIAFIATWDGVGYYSLNSDLTNTFQCVLASDKTLSFVIFLYADGGIQWTTGDNSGGNYGFGGTQAQVGVNAGDGVQSSLVPESQTAAIIDIAKTSNVRKPGVWIFQVNQEIRMDLIVCRHEEIFSGGVTYVWMKTSSGTKINFICPKNPAFSVSRVCSAGGTWQNFDLEGCGILAGQLDTLITAILTREMLGKFLTEFSDIVALSKDRVVDQTIENLKLIADIFEKVVSFIVENSVPVTESQIVTNVVRTVDSLMQWTPTSMEAATSSRILKSFEDILSLYIWQIPKNSSQATNFTSVVLVAEKLNLEELQNQGRMFAIGLGYDYMTHPSENGTDSQLTPQQEAVIHLPMSLFGNINDYQNIGMFFTFYNMSTLFPVGERDTENSIPSHVKVGSSVIAATVGGDNLIFENLTEAVQISFRIRNDSIISGSEVCVSWDFDLQDWNPRGCTSTYGQTGTIICSCNHLTNFAVLVDICLREQDCQPSRVEKVLTYISYIGMTTSIVSMIFTLIILLGHKRIRQKKISKYHIQLSFSLLLMLIVSLVLVVLSAENFNALYGGCVTVSVLVHYFTLVAVMWMGAEALFMFQRLVLVFIEINNKYIIIVSIVCWGLPIIPAILPVFIDLANGSDPGTDLVIQRTGAISYCFLSDVGVFWGAFLAPIILVLLFNFVIFIWIAAILIHHARHSATRNVEVPNNKNNVQLVITISGVMFLFGITWLFAILTFSVAGLRETFQILFTLFNSFQGFFIFLFFCTINKEARETWRELFGSGQQSELPHMPNDKTNGKATYVKTFRDQSQSRTDFSSLKLNEHVVSKTEGSRKDSWSSFNSSWRSEPALEGEEHRLNLGYHIIVSIGKRECQPNYKTSSNSFSHNISAITESGIDQTDTMSATETGSISKIPSRKPSSSLTSSVAELETDHTSYSNAKPNRKSSKDSASLKVQIRRYSSTRNEGSNYDIEMEVEEMAVELHSETSSDGSDGDSDLNN